VDLRASKDVQTVAGLIVGLRTMKSKRGETLAFVTLDDRSGRLEVSVFADLFEANHTKLQKDQLVVMKGSLSADDFSGGLKMRAAEVLDLLEARERTIKCLRLSLNETRLDAGFSEELARLLQPYKGEGCRVSIEYQRNDAVAEVSLGDAWRVSPDDQLIQNLRDRYGADQVQFDY
jgi:DNA polymerase-3 subunit alpha